MNAWEDFFMKKIISLLLCITCLFSLTGCIDPSMFGFGEMEPDKVVPKIESFLNETQQDNEQKLNFQVEYDEGFDNYVVTFWVDECGELWAASVRYLHKHNGSSDAQQVVNQWKNLTNEMIAMSNQIEDKIKKYDKDAYVNVNFVNADNHEDILFSCSGGVVLEDIMDLG